MPAMPIGPITMVAVFATVWWTVLFAVLPLGSSNEDQAPPTDGSQWGAPSNPQLKKKFFTTTWVALILWVVIMLVIWSGLMPLPTIGSA